MTRSIEELAKHVEGTVVGDASIQIESVSTLETAQGGQIAFLANRKYRKQALSSQASAIITKEKLETETPQIIAADPYYAFRQIVVLLHGHRQHPFSGVSPAAHIAESAQVSPKANIAPGVTISDGVTVGEGTTLYPGVFVGPDTQIGENCILYPNCVVFDKTTIGDRVIIQSNASVGHDGFGFATHQGGHHKIPHVANVILEDDVEIGANACIESGAFDNTIIGTGAKIGDSVVIGHGTKIGRGCLLVPQVGIAGSAELGEYSQMGGQAGITGHTKVGARAIIAAKSLVNHNLGDNQAVMGFPAFDIRQARKAVAIYKNLPKQHSKIQDMERKIQQLESLIEETKPSTER